MAVTITQDDILSVRADAAVLSIENGMVITEEPTGRSLAAAGGAALRERLLQEKFLPVGSAAVIPGGELPFSHVILTAAPHWLTGKANELLILHRCYEAVYEQARLLGCNRLVMPFLSAAYYRFPREEAVNIALSEARRQPVETVFVAATEELHRLSGRTYHKPRIVSYVGYYRDHAIFALENGLYARIDLRPELRDVAVIPYFEACYREGNNPLQRPLDAAQIARLREIYETTDW